MVFASFDYQCCCCLCQIHISSVEDTVSWEGHVQLNIDIAHVELRRHRVVKRLEPGQLPRISIVVLLISPSSLIGYEPSILETALYKKMRGAMNALLTGPVRGRRPLPKDHNRPGLKGHRVLLGGSSKIGLRYTKKVD